MANADGVYVLGAVRASVAGQETMLAGAQPRVVLAYLAWSPGRSITADELAEALWPETRKDHWNGALRGVVAKVRAFLAEAGYPVTVGTQGGNYQCDVADPTCLDITRGRRLLDSARQAAAACDHERCVVAVRSTLEVFSEPLLPGVDGEWLAPRRAALRDWHRLALLTGAPAHSALGNHDTAIEYATRAVEDDQLDESCHRALIVAEAAAGRRAAALRAYGRCRRVLADELGVAPDPATEALYLQLIALDAAPVAGALPDHPRRFVGREPELELLRAAWREARSGHRCLLAIHGEAGIGKTQLALQAVRLTSPDRVLYGRSSPEQTVPYQPFAEAIGQHFAQVGDDELRALVDTVAPRLVGVIPSLARRGLGVHDPDLRPDRASVFDAFLTVLERITVEPTVFVLDDVHHADIATHLLSRFLMHRLEDRPLLVIVTYRDDVPADAALVETIVEFNRFRRHRAIPVTGLTVDDVGELLRSHDLTVDADIATALHHRTGGNGFYLAQVIESVGESPDEVDAGRVPDTVAELIRSRMSTLSRPAREVLACAAVLGLAMPSRQLEAMIDQGHGNLDSLDELFDRRLLVEQSDDRIAFPHGIVRDAVYGQLSRTRRRRFHVDAARVVAAGHVPVDWATIAHHYGQADDPANAAEMLEATRRAADRAMTTHAYEHAAVLYERAGTQADRFGFDERTIVDFQLGLGAALRRSADLSGARSALEAAIARARTARLPVEFARCVLEFTAGGGRGAAVELSDEERAELLQEAIDGVDDDDPGLVVSLLAELSLALLLTDESERRHDVASRAMAIAADSGSVEVRARAAIARRLLNMTPDRAADRLAATDELIGPGDELPYELSVRLHMWRLTDCLELGDRTGVDRELAALRSTADELGQVYWGWIAASWTALHSFTCGDEDRADAEAATALAMGDVLGHPEVAFAYGIQHVGFRMRQRRGGEVVELLQSVFVDAPHIPAVRCGLAACLAQADRHDEARDHLTHLMSAGLSEIPYDSNWGVSLAALTEAACELDDRELAAALLDRVESYRNQWVVVSAFGGGGVCWGPYSGISGSLYACLGRSDEARRAFEDSLSRLRSFGAAGLVTYETTLRDARVPVADAML